MNPKNCNRNMAERKYGADTGCACNQCRADRKAKRAEAKRKRSLGVSA